MQCKMGGLGGSLVCALAAAFAVQPFDLPRQIVQIDAAECLSEFLLGGREEGKDHCGH